MTFLSAQLLKLTKRLYPKGRAFRLPESGVLERLHISLNKSEEAAYLDAIGILDTILPDNENFGTDDALDWEVRLGLNVNPALELVDRKAAILRKMNHPSDKLERAHFLFIQKQLQIAGFRVFVYENRFPDGSGGFSVKNLARWIEQHYNLLFTVTFQHGQIQHGQSQLFNAFEKVVNFLSNEEDSTVNVVNGRQTFFIGGDTPGKYANVKATRETEFRKLILQLKPVESAALLAIRYGDGLFDDLSTVAPTPTSINLTSRFILINNRLYYQSSPATIIRVWDIFTDAEIPGEAMGSGIIQNSQSIDFDYENNKMYVLDHGATPQVRVFNVTTGAAIPGENFGVGTIVLQSANLRVNKGECFVYRNNSGGEIDVFTISGGALDRTFSMSSTDINEFTIDLDTIIATQSGAGNSVRFFDLQGVEDLERKITEGISSPAGLYVENGFLYLCNLLENVLRVYDVFRGGNELTTLGFGANSARVVAVSDNNLLWTDGSSLFRRERNT